MPEPEADPAGDATDAPGAAGAPGAVAHGEGGDGPMDSRRARLWEWADVRGIPLQTILVTVLVVAAVYLTGRLIYKLREVLVILVLAAFIALLLDPLVLMLNRAGVKRRGTAVTIVTVFAILVFAGLATAFGYPLVNGLTHLANKLPTYVDQAEHGTGWLGHLVRKYHVQHWVQQNAPKIASFAKGLGKPALSLGKGALSILFALVALFMLVLLLLLEAPKLRRGVLSLMHPRRAERAAFVASQVSRSVTGYMAGNFITSVIAGVVVYVTLTIMGVPFALLWALWVALVDFIPMIGGALAGIPTVLFALTHSLAAGIVTLVVFLVYTQVENHVLNPVVMSRTVKINPLFVLIAILVGANLGSLAGGFFGAFVGTLIAIPVAGSIQVIVRELWRSTAPPEEAAAAPGPAGSGGPTGPAPAGSGVGAQPA
ncbi:MAG TPA: AI-2E family transporter [Acidimicrobiales bacterium]|nr:AI-2E family transporter [Acidimicrobiales bacterium]